MDIKAYISSGIIEACITGIASDEEVRQMEHYCQQYPEIQKAVSEARQTVEKLASLHAVNPPDFLKNKIWDAINNSDLSSEQNKTLGGKKKMTQKEDKGSAKMLHLKYYIAATIALLIVSIGFNLYFWQRGNDLQQNLATLESQVLAQNKMFAAKTASYKHNLNLVLASGMQRINLQGVGTHKSINGLVLWNKNTGSLYLSLADLPTPPKNKQYQLWAIVDGKPVSAGLYHSSSAILQRMDLVKEKVQMFAVTLEKKGGVFSPTMSAMYVAGKI